MVSKGYMANLVQLDKAADVVGKSEVTLRRLIKAGKVPFEREKTLTGFIYLVDPEKIRAYYLNRGGEEVTFTTSDSENNRVNISTQPVKVAVATDSGGATEYWQKKSERYEEKYNDEVIKHSHTREELGVWRGRAEQTQAMLLKLLPSGPQEVEVSAKGSVETKKQNDNTSMMVIAVALIVLLLLAGAAIVYLKIAPH